MYTHICTDICTSHIYMCICNYVCGYIHIYTYLHMYVHIHTCTLVHSLFVQVHLFARIQLLLAVHLPADKGNYRGFQAIRLARGVLMRRVCTGSGAFPPRSRKQDGTEMPMSLWLWLQPSLLMIHSSASQAFQSPCLQPSLAQSESRLQCSEPSSSAAECLGQLGST